jgi:glycopeptide antibiotics resistance protein
MAMRTRPIDRFSRYAFYLSVLVVLYGTLFPFEFKLPLHGYSLVPYWDIERGRIHSLPDIASNVLLTVPVGFFGFLCFDRGKKPAAIAKWLAMGLALGVISEIIQLAIPSRTSEITDVLNNGLGALFGAVGALLFGEEILDLLSGSLLNKERTTFVILLGIAVSGALLPFDFSIDVSHLRSSLKQLWLNPWELGKPLQDDWIQLAVFAMLGGVAGTMRPRLTRFALTIPFVLESMQLIIESHSPTLRDLALNLAGVAGGIAAARFVPSMVRPATGFILMNIALVVQGLSPYHFAGKSQFTWIPLIEYYYKSTGSALFDAVSGILNFGLLVALWPRKTTIVWGIALASAIEAAQLFLPRRYAGITDILMAAIGCCVGYAIKTALDTPDVIDYQK